MKFKDLSAEQMCELMAIHIPLVPDNRYFMDKTKGEYNIEFIKYTAMDGHPPVALFLVSCNVFADEYMVFVFERFYIEEIRYLMSIGVDFKE